MKPVVLAAVLALSVALPGNVQAADILGTREVAYRSERDVINVPGRKRYREVQLCVKRHAVRFRDVDVVFGNGSRQNLVIRRIIPKGSCTRWIDMKGRRRDILRIVLRYDTYGDRGPRALVTARAR